MSTAAAVDGATADAPAAIRAAAHPRLSAGRLLAGHDPAELVGAFGSPLYVYDLDVIADRVALLRAALPAAVEVAYAVKANPSPAVLRHLAGLGLGADVASAGELAAVHRAGFAAGDVIFTGPGKTDAEIEAALRAGIRALTIESLEELEVVIGSAGLAHSGQGLLLRLAVEGIGEATPIIGGVGGIGSAKFGLLPEEVDEAIERLRGRKVIGPGGTPYRLLGLHAFGASNVLDADVLVDGVRRLAVQAEAIAARHGLDLRLLDGGGGLGIPYDTSTAPMDVQRLGIGVRRELATWSLRPGLTTARLLFEPGRFLVGPAGAYLTRVVRTKRRGDRTMAITDGGINHLLRPALIRQQQALVAVGELAERPVDTQVDVVGPLCTGLDVLATGVELPQPHSGDLVAVLDAGAYGFTESMPLFLSHPVPAEVVTSGGVLRVDRPRSEPGLD